MSRYSNKQTYNAQTGEMRNDKKVMSMLEDFWLPRREGGRGTEISTLPGGQNLGEITDLEYFRNKLYAALEFLLPVHLVVVKDLIWVALVKSYEMKLSSPSS